MRPTPGSSRSILSDIRPFPHTCDDGRSGATAGAVFDHFRYAFAETHDRMVSLEPECVVISQAEGAAFAQSRPLLRGS